MSAINLSAEHPCCAYTPTDPDPGLDGPPTSDLLSTSDEAGFLLLPSDLTIKNWVAREAGPSRGGYVSRLIL
jgi:hypothetical protein